MSAGQRTFVGIVTAACVVASILTWIMLREHDNYSTDIGERRSVTLSDGSTIDLNARSRIRVRFSNGERDVELIDGQALFQVAQDKARPFVVHSGATQVRAVGTQFDVYRKKSGTTVTVLEGRVAIFEQTSTSPASSPRVYAETPEPTIVAAGEQVTVTGQAVTPPKHADVAVATSWTRRQLVFEGARLGDVAEDFNRYNRQQLVIESPGLQDFHISGVYSSTDPASLIRFLRAQPGIDVVETEQEVRVTRKSVRLAPALPGLFSQNRIHFSRLTAL